MPQADRTIVKPSRYSSALAALLTLAGVAIGLGNVWRFPYMMGSHGGMAFVVIYLVVLVLFALPALMAEWGLGATTREGPIGAYQATLGTIGRWLGWLLVAGIFVADSYYIVVIGNIAYSAFFAASFGMTEDHLSTYQRYLGNGLVQYLFALIVLALGVVTLGAGLRAGIERASRWFVPIFAIVMVYLLVHSLTLPRVGEKLTAFVIPDFGQINATAVFAATGQACFSLGIGGAIMVIYGGFLGPETAIPRAAIATGLSDLGGALLAALAIVPAVLAFGLDIASGPGLLFDTAPRLFAVMPGGRLAASAFLGALTLMAFLSALAGLAVCQSGLQRLGFKTSGGLLLSLFVIEALLIAPSAFYPPLIGHLDLVFGSGMQILGALIAVVAVTFGARRADILRRLFASWPRWAQNGMGVWLRYITPVVLGAVLIGYVVETLW